MLTFQFSGAEGSMTESATLTSGMAGKEIQFLFDDSWENLAKTAVFSAGDTTRVVVDVASTVTIPKDVLTRPFVKLYVGVYGTDADGSVVIPTVMAEGPMIRYGADPIEDETAAELPVWQKLQNQIGNLSVLSTDDKSSLVSAANELLTRMEQLLGKVGLNPEAAQLLVGILSCGQYTSDQTENIDALADKLGVMTPEELSKLTLYWDFRGGSLTDQIAGLEAVTSQDVVLDAAGAHVATNASYIMFPAGLNGASLAGHTAEIKFGQMSLDETASIMRLCMVCTDEQPASAGLQWSIKDCWSTMTSVVTEFTDMNMFSGKTLTVKANDDGSQIDYYFEDQLIVSSTPGFVHSHLSIGTTVNGAFPLTVEYVRIYPNT